MRTLKHVFKPMTLEMYIHDFITKANMEEHEIQRDLLQMTAAKRKNRCNFIYNIMHGFSPSQWVFGLIKEPGHDLDGNTICLDGQQRTMNMLVPYYNNEFPLEVKDPDFNGKFYKDLTDVQREILDNTHMQISFYMHISIEEARLIFNVLNANDKRTNLTNAEIMHSSIAYTDFGSLVTDISIDPKFVDAIGNKNKRKKDKGMAAKYLARTAQFIKSDDVEPLKDIRQDGNVVKALIELVNEKPSIIKTLDIPGMAKRGAAHYALLQGILTKEDKAPVRHSETQKLAAMVVLQQAHRKNVRKFMKVMREAEEYACESGTDRRFLDMIEHLNTVIPSA